MFLCGHFAQAFQKYGHLDQSLFARFVRLGVPTVTLDFQGRARPSISALYSWRYPGLKDLPSTSEGTYAKANAGFALDYQLVDVRHCPAWPTLCFLLPFAVARCMEFVRLTLLVPQCRCKTTTDVVNRPLQPTSTKIWARRNTSAPFINTCDCWDTQRAKLLF